MEALECKKVFPFKLIQGNISNKEHGSAAILVCETRTGPDIYVYQIALSMKVMELTWYSLFNFIQWR